MPDADARHRLSGALIAAGATAYLIPFVARGWVPHDEGMLGQSADRVLHGALPHVDYEEPYTGALTYLYAAVFRFAGIDLLNIRWLLLLAAAGVIGLTYLIARRQMKPFGAALAVWVGTAWSFPNYFAALPSWWLLLCALFQLWAMTRAAETGRPSFIMAAAAAAGTALTIKQTGAYLVVALTLWILFDGGVVQQRSRRQQSIETAARWLAAGAAVVFAAVMIGRRLLAADGLFLFAPAAATAVALWLPRREPPALSAEASTRSPIATAAGAAIVAALPVAALLAPYILRNRVDDFIRGVLILPQKRLAFASMAMPSGWWIGAAVVPLGLYLLARRIDSRRTPVNGALWAVAAGLPVAAMWSAAAYQIVWQSVRAAAAVLPIIIVWQLAAGRVESRRQRSIRFGAAAVLAWASLNQFPFAAPIYFSYTMPLVVVAALVAADADADGLRRGPALPLAAMMLAFALLITNRGDLHSLGRFYQPVRLDTELGFPRAHLRVAAGEAAVYRRLSSLITTHYRGGQLIAAPDCPEVYFLAGLESPSGALFDFFSTAAADPRPWLNAEVIIINHEPQFSPAPPPELTAALRRSFVNGEEIGRFEFRWR